jgi:hypothetical protein
MNDPQPNEDALANASREEITSALFANMVIQQTNMALMLMGKVPHPETGETIQDIEAARLFIDQLEMLELKTRGNLDTREEKLLKQSLTALRMAFVETVNRQTSEPQSTSPAASASTPGPDESSAKPPTAGDQAAAPAAEEESRKKFSKKY